MDHSAKEEGRVDHCHVVVLILRLVGILVGVLVGVLVGTLVGFPSTCD